MSPALISIRFCGGCNPRIDRGRIARELRQALEERGVTVKFNDPEAGFIIFLSGCLSECAVKFNPHSGPYITVADHTVDTEPVDEARIVQEVLRKVDAHYG